MAHGIAPFTHDHETHGGGRAQHPRRAVSALISFSNSIFLENPGLALSNERVCQQNTTVYISNDNIACSISSAVAFDNVELEQVITRSGGGGLEYQQRWLVCVAALVYPCRKQCFGFLTRPDHSINKEAVYDGFKSTKVVLPKGEARHFLNHG